MCINFFSKPLNFNKIQRFLEPKKMEIELDKGDVVEVIGGPFKGEKGKVVRYDKPLVQH